MKKVLIIVISISFFVGCTGDSLLKAVEENIEEYCIEHPEDERCEDFEDRRDG